MLVATIDYHEPAGDAGEAAAPGWRPRPQRRAIGHASTVRDDRSRPHDVQVEDLSATGCSFVGTTPLPVGSIVRVGLAGAGVTRARIVWRRANRYGCAFLDPLAPRQLAEAFGAAEAVAALPGTRLNDRIEPDHALWPGAVRLLTLVGLGSLAWAAVAAGVYAATR